MASKFQHLITNLLSFGHLIGLFWLISFSIISRDIAKTLISDSTTQCLNTTDCQHSGLIASLTIQRTLALVMSVTVGDRNSLDANNNQTMITVKQSCDFAVGFALLTFGRCSMMWLFSNRMFTTV